MAIADDSDLYRLAIRPNKESQWKYHEMGKHKPVSGLSCLIFDWFGRGKSQLEDAEGYRE